MDRPSRPPPSTGEGSTNAVAIVGAAEIIGGSFLPWQRVSLSTEAGIWRMGTDSNAGFVILLLGVLTLALLIADATVPVADERIWGTGRRTLKLWVLGLGGTAAGGATIAAIESITHLGDLNGGSIPISVQPAIGIFVVLAGGVLVMAAVTFSLNTGGELDQQVSRTALSEKSGPATRPNSREHTTSKQVKRYARPRRRARSGG